MPPRTANWLTPSTWGRLAYPAIASRATSACISPASLTAGSVLTLKVACRSASGWTVREEAAWAEAMTTGASPCKIRERTPSRCCSYSPETLSIWR